MQSDDTPIWRQKDVSRSNVKTFDASDIVELHSGYDQSTLIDMYSGEFESGAFHTQLKHELNKRE